MSVLTGGLSLKSSPPDLSVISGLFPSDNESRVDGHSPFFASIFNSQGHSPPIHIHHDHNSGVHCFVDGEIYAGSDFNGENSAHYLCRHYLKTQKTWQRNIRGSFACVLWDPRVKKLLLFCDPAGLKPLYFYHCDQYFLCSTRIDALSCLVQHKDKQLEWSALSDFLTFENVLGSKTWIKSITRLLGGQELRLNNNTVTNNTLWSLSTCDHLTGSLEQMTDHISKSFIETLSLYSQQTATLGVYLTSGLDSRMIAGGLHTLKIPFSSFNYGIEGSRDSVWGQAIAKKLRVPFTYFPLTNGQWVSECFDDFVRHTEGHVNGMHMHGMNTYKAVGSQIDTHLSGHGGGSFLGGDTSSHEASHSQDISEIKKFMLDHYSHTLGNVFRDNQELKRLLTPDTYDMIMKQQQQSFSEEFDRHTEHPIDNIGDSFILANRYQRVMAHMIAAERAYFECRTPFMDHLFLEGVFSVPIKMRLNRHYQINLLNHLFPSLVAIPWQATCLPPTHNSRVIWTHIVLRKLHRMFGPLVGKPHRLPTEPGRNYPQWVYTDGQSWLQKNLSELEEQPFFQWDQVRDFVSEFSTTMTTRPYQEQRSHVYKISAIFTWLKTWQRIGRPV